jgi:hypothetical protein
VRHFVSVDEVETGERHDPVAIERWLEREIEAGERLDRREPGHSQRRLDPAALAQRELLGEEPLDRLDGRELAALELLDQVIEGFQGGRRAQADQTAPDPLDRRLRQSLAPHEAALARRLPTAL